MINNNLLTTLLARQGNPNMSTGPTPSMVGQASSSDLAGLASLLGGSSTQGLAVPAIGSGGASSGGGLASALQGAGSAASAEATMAPPSLADGLWAKPPQVPPAAPLGGPQGPQQTSQGQAAPPSPMMGAMGAGLAANGGPSLNQAMAPHQSPAIVGAGGNPTVPPAKHAHLPPEQQRWANGQQIQGAIANGGAPNPTLLRVMLGQKS